MAKRILLVEDDENLSDSYATLLHKEGYDIVVASNGDDALVKAKDFNPDLILLDLLMPGSTGLDFLKKYNPVVEHADVKIIIFTNLDILALKTEALKYGIAHYITKSLYTPKELAELISQELKSTK